MSRRPCAARPTIWRPRGCPESPAFPRIAHLAWVMDVERIDLPGIGTSHVVTTARGRRIGIVSHRTGRRDLVVYDKEDPDTSVVSLALNADEANAIAEYLGTARII